MALKWVSEYKHPQNWLFRIEQETMHDIQNQEEVEGFYIHVSDENGEDLHDYLQDDLETAKSFTLRKFKVPENSWKLIEK